MALSLKVGLLTTSCLYLVVTQLNMHLVRELVKSRWKATLEEKNEWEYPKIQSYFITELYTLKFSLYNTEILLWECSQHAWRR